MKRFPLLFTPLFFLLLTVVLTYPLILHLPTYVADRGDPLLNTWALAWGRYAFLHPWSSINDLFNANAFYPYRHSLGFSENLLIFAALTMPLAALHWGPVFAHNSAILFSIVLAGWGMALLVTHWTKNRWAGLVAGVIFAFVPARLNHWGHLHQLSIHWLPFIVLYLDRWLSRQRWRDLAFFGLVLNFQLLSTINYIPQSLILTALFFLYGSMRYPGRLFTKQALSGGLIVLATTLLINWPIVKVYFDLKELHGFERGLGDASIYGASLIDYATPPPENVLYGDWLTRRLHRPDRPLIPLFVGVGPGLLALVGVITLASKDRFAVTHRKVVFSLLLLTVVAVVLSFGANQQALGERLSSITGRFLFYRWLFEYVPGFSGLRVPARMAILAFFGLAALAGIGVARLTKNFRFPKAALPALILLVVIEYLPLPLPGTQVAVGQNIPPVYRTLASNPAGKVVLELPYGLGAGEGAELPRLYFSSYGWYKLVNGASGFNPAGLEDLSAMMHSFPDAISFDAVRRLGVTHLVLHAAEFRPEQWQSVWSRLPAYWPFIGSLSQFGDDYLLTLKPPACSPQPNSIVIQPIQKHTRLGLVFTNNGPTTFVATPPAVNRIEAGDQSRQFVEPLLIPAGEEREVGSLLAVSEEANFEELISLTLPALSVQADIPPNGTVSAPGNPPKPVSPPETPLAVKFGDTLRLLGYDFDSREGPACRTVTLRLYWEAAAAIDPALQSAVRLVDRFGQTVASAVTNPAEWKQVSRAGNSFFIDDHQLPIAETVPAGQFGLTLQVLAEGGAALEPSTPADLPVLGPEVLLSDILVHPGVSAAGFVATEPVGAFENGVTLLDYEVDKTTLAPGDWLHLTLYWQAEKEVPADLTVFTQLIDSQGQVRAQQDNPPRTGWYPTPLWQPDQVIPDDYFVYLDPETAGGTLRLIVGFYRPDTLVRVAVENEAGEIVGDSLTVTSFDLIRNPE